MVLNVPAEAAEAHAHVRPGDLHARDVPVHVAQDGPPGVGEVVEVPARIGVVTVLQGGRRRGLLPGEATPNC